MELNIKFDEKMLVATANCVLDEYEYNGKTIREWADIILNPRTKADRIRTMTDEELATMIAKNIDCCVCRNKNPVEDDECPSAKFGKSCSELWLEWLQQECE